MACGVRGCGSVVADESGVVNCQLTLKAVNCPAVNSFVVGEFAVGDCNSFETQKADRTCTAFIVSCGGCVAVEFTVGNSQGIVEITENCAATFIGDVVVELNIVYCQVYFVGCADRATSIGSFAVSNNEVFDSKSGSSRNVGIDKKGARCVVAADG